MASPEQLARRVDRHEDDIRAISDTLIEIKEVVDEHTETLAENGRKLDAIDSRLGALETRVAEGFAEILSLLRPGQ